MNTTRDSKGRSPNSRRRRAGPPTKGHRYVVTTADVVPDDLIELISRAHAAALAMTHLDRASELLDQSFIQVFRDNLSMSSLHVMLAELYLEARAIDESRERLEALLKVFPANGHAKLVSAKVYAAQGNEEAGREALVEALEIWSDADADFIYGVESKSLMNRL